MVSLTDEALDQGLDYLTTNGTQIDLCSQEPTTYAEATSTYTLGNGTVTTSATADGATDGRSVTTTAITNGTTTGTGTATHWALTDGSSLLLATKALSSSEAVTSGQVFSLDPIIITHRDAT